MANRNYYAENLHSERLRQVYETELPRVAEYLEREIGFVRSRLKKSDCVLEIAAGYGRIMREIAPGVKSVTGIDISEKNVASPTEKTISKM
ncbi:MAG: class I SAM-dependent methyltransferase [Synergistaceae bacterium]|nr:class I SAM-dependent methyltransferase [Synergistaceae bacterium]